MGTNFYLRDTPACTHCSRGPDRGRHIGKSSGGWVFTLRIYPDAVPPIRDLADWIPLFDLGVVNEYGEDISAVEMLRTITERAAWCAQGRALKRHALDDFCIAHGQGTYDLCVGEFS